MAYRGTLAGYTSSVKYAAVTAWAASVSKSIGNFVRQTSPAVDDERVFMCITAGTTQGSEPSWDVNKGHKTTESTVVWIECTGQPGINGDFVNTPNWTTVRNQSIDLGHIIKDNAGTHLFICTTSGNTNNTAEPTWNTSAVGNTTTDSSVTWMYIGTSFSGWSAPFARLRQQGIWAQTSDINQYFVGHDHAETQASGWNMHNGNTSQNNQGIGNNAAGPVSVHCVSTSGSTPPVSADLATTGTVTTTGSNSMTCSFGYMRYCYGLSFSAGTSAGVNMGAGGGDVKDKFYESCTFALGTGTTSGGDISFNGNPGHGKLRFKNCTFKFANSGQYCDAASHVILEACTFDFSSATPTRLWSGMTNGAYLQIIGSDISGMGTNNLVYTGSGGEAFTIDFIDCKLPSAPSYANLFNNCTAARINFIRCDNGSVTYKNAAADRSGKMTTDAGIVRTGGATDGTTAFSWRIDTSLYAMIPSQPFDAPMITNDNAVTGSTVNVTVHGIFNSASLPTVDDVCAEVRYLGTSGDPLASFKTNKRTDYLATTTPANLSADTGSAWDTAATARANSHSYSVGDIISVSSNTGRIFFCTSAGTSAGSLPGGYATAIDGGSVTDSGATFRAGVRFSFTIALSSPAPALAGPVYTQVSFGTPSATFFIDPAVVLS